MRQGSLSFDELAFLCVCMCYSVKLPVCNSPTPLLLSKFPRGIEMTLGLFMFFLEMGVGVC